MESAEAVAAAVSRASGFRAPVRYVLPPTDLGIWRYYGIAPQYLGSGCVLRLTSSLSLSLSLVALLNTYVGSPTLTFVIRPQRCALADEGEGAPALMAGGPSLDPGRALDGMTYVQIEVSNPEDPERCLSVRALVDTGSTDCELKGRLIDQLDLRPDTDAGFALFETAAGIQTEAQIYRATIRVRGREALCPLSPAEAQAEEEEEEDDEEDGERRRRTRPASMRLRLRLDLRRCRTTHCSGTTPWRRWASLSTVVAAAYSRCHPRVW